MYHIIVITVMKSFKTCLPLIISFLLAGSKIIASDVFTTTPFLYDYELSTTQITALAQDQNGRIWIAGRECLYHFDGYRVEKIPVPRHKAVTSQHVINNIHADSHNRIWLALGTGVCRYDPADGSFTYKFPHPDDMLNMGNVVYDILENSDGTLYFATRNGIFMIPPGKDELVRYQGFKWHEVCSGYKSEERIVMCMHIDRNNALWVGTGGDGVTRIDLRNGSSMQFKYVPGDKNSLCNNDVRSILEDPFGVMWFGTTDGLSMFQKESATFTPLRNRLAFHSVNMLSYDDQGNILAGTNEGLALIERKTHKELWFRNKTGRSTTVPTEATTSILRDLSGRIWTGTTKGLACLDEPKDFALFGNESADTACPALKDLRILVADNQRLWIGLQSGGMRQFDLTTQVFKNYASTLPAAEGYKMVVSAYLTRGNELLVGTEAGLLKYNSHSDSFEPFSFLPSGAPQKNAYAITEDRKGDFWLGILDEGVFRYHPGSDSLEKIPISYENIYKNIYTNIKSLHEDRQGNIWIVFWRAGILRYNPVTREEKLFTQENTNGELLNNTVWDVKEDERGQLWLATAGGVCTLNPDKNTFSGQELLSALNGMSVIAMIKNPEDGKVWLSTTEGVVRFDPQTGNMIRFSEMDGLQGRSFTSGVRARIDSLLFLGGSNGLNVINMRKTFTNPYIPQPRLTKIVVNERTLPAMAQKTDVVPLSLKTKQGDQVEVFFSGFSFRKEWRNHYRYQISGYDSTWRWITDSRVNSVKLPLLKSGSYTFKVMASNCDGVWSAVTPLMKLEVTSVWPFYIALFTSLLALSAGLFVYRKRIRKIITRGKRRKKSKSREASENKSMDGHTQYLLEKLTKLMKEDKVYLNKRLTKSDVAGYLKITELQLSQLLHSHYDKSFPDFINTYRVKAVKQRLENIDSRDYTLLALGDECGFNSKSSFYRVFKEHTGVTPAEYLDQLRK